MQAKACDDLARLFNEQMADAGLKAGAEETYATPRRLALIARGLPLETEAVREERRGRSEEHTSELQSLMRISYAAFCLIKKHTIPTTLLITVQDHPPTLFIHIFITSLLPVYTHRFSLLF